MSVIVTLHYAEVDHHHYHQQNINPDREHRRLPEPVLGEEAERRHQNRRDHDQNVVPRLVLVVPRIVHQVGDGRGICAEAGAEKRPGASTGLGR